jgi:hypothetical protein
MATPLESFPVAVTMVRKLIRRSGWALPSWEATGVVTGPQFAGEQRSRELVRESGDVQHFLFRGLSVQLYRDAAEVYWFNLVAERPSLFVVCLKEDGEELVPVRVTADSGEAQAAVETNGAAFAVAIPPEIHEALERVVVAHYRPEPPRKRKQHDWNKGEN